MSFATGSGRVASIGASRRVNPDPAARGAADYRAASSPVRRVRERQWGIVRAQMEAGHVPSLGLIDESADGPVTTPATPGAVPFRPGNWDFKNGTYTVAFGDTLCGVAITYLGACTQTQLMAIWSLQSALKAKGRTMSNLVANEDVLVMPQAAIDRAKALLASPPQNTAPSTIGKQAPIAVAGEDKNAPVVDGGTAAAAGSFVSKHKVAIGVGAGVLVLAGVGYAVTR